MPDTLDRARLVIEERLHELEAEAQSLRNALASLGQGDRQTRKRRPARRTTKRAARGERQKQLLDSIRRNPSYKATEHAKAIGISPNQVYSLANKLQEQGKITKTGTGTYKVKRSKVS
jgi:predicted Rossmann fold nucleotide-binding protein DprA/Smf involved in DNA uptake